ncbi:hypothetical protein QJS10_CPB13g01490 [Acorus calamus]|uniref:Increased DNA methylation 1 C-terminal domain-containing protein n=1 Tax=Acorus calamus TaxID=4465 RepID=A0AAV9DJF9_ACOCL|nr:hypothetical protein QJS10_CPB13g01490 [Acorus calamus]
MECQRQAWEKEKKLRNVGFQNFGVDDLDPTDDTCGVCADGGHLIICDGCPSTFHKDCLLLKVAAGLTLIMGTLNSVGEGFTWTLLKHLDEDTEGISEQNRFLYLERNVKLSLALSVLYECFVPLVDPRTGVDMISQVTYNCGIHGTRLAEMPFIGTRPKFRRQGMCRRLLSAIEDLLSSLRVEKLIIPAIADLLETWKTSFSFNQLESSHKDDIRNSSLMIFPETTLLQKPIRVAETRSKKENELLETQNFLNSIVMTIKDKDCVIDDPDFQLQWRFYFDGQSTQSFQNLGASLGEVDVVSVSNRHRCVQTSNEPNNVDSLVSTRS